MPDILNLTVTPVGKSTVRVPRVKIECMVVDSNNQSVVLLNLTGPNAITFPDVLDTLAEARVAEIESLVRNLLIKYKLQDAGYPVG